MVLPISVENSFNKDVAATISEASYLRVVPESVSIT